MDLLVPNGSKTNAMALNADSEIVMVDLGFGDDFFRTRSVMGRLWDDHFRDLGHPPKFYRVQDAGFIGGSSL